jgi:hypothetical protein
VEAGDIVQGARADAALVPAPAVTVDAGVGLPVDGLFGDRPVQAAGSAGAWWRGVALAADRSWSLAWAGASVPQREHWCSGRGLQDMHSHDRGPVRRPGSRSFSQSSQSRRRAGLLR